MSTNLTPYDELTDKRQLLLKVIEENLDDGRFTRSHLNAVLYYEDHSEILDEDDDEDTDTVQTTTGLLNKIVEDDGYLAKPVQGGGTAFVLDRNANEDRDERVTGVTPSELSEMAHQILDRNGVSRDLSHVDFGDWGEVLDAVNSAIGKKVLIIRAKPNRYELRETAAEVIRKHRE